MAMAFAAAVFAWRGGLLDGGGGEGGGGGGGGGRGRGGRGRGKPGGWTEKGLLGSHPVGLCQLTEIWEYIAGLSIGRS